jgi:hypothetical protein
MYVVFLALVGLYLGRAHSRSGLSEGATRPSDGSRKSVAWAVIVALAVTVSLFAFGGWAWGVAMAVLLSVVIGMTLWVQSRP